VNDLISWLRQQLDATEFDASDVHSIDCAIRNSYPDARIDCDCGWPERVLRQVQAHRAILDRYADALARGDDPEYSMPEAWTQAREYEDFVIPALVSIYSDRDDYKAEWA
jgi:hypothetical protein